MMKRPIPGSVLILLLLTLAACAPQRQAGSTSDQTASGRHLDQAIDAVRKGQVDRAQQLFDQAIKSDPKNADAYNNKGNLLMSSRKYKQAIPEYSAAIQLQANRAPYIFNRAYAYLLTGSQREALKDLNRVLELEQGNFKALAFRGQVRMNLADFEGAVSDFDRVVALRQENGGVYANRGVAKAQIGRLAAAKDDFLKAEAIFRKTADLASLEKLDKARSALKGSQNR